MHALACVAGALIATAPAVDVPLGDRALPLELAVEVRTVGHGASAPALVWRTRPDGTLEGRGRGDGFDASVGLVPLPGGARRIEIAIRWRTRAELERASLGLRWRGAPRAVGRDLAFTPVARARRTGRGTPILVAAGGAVLSGGPGLVSARVERDGGGVAATLFLDDVDERPFTVYDACLDHLPDGSDSKPISWSALEARHAIRGAPRSPGDEDFARATLHPLSDASPLLPVVVQRWPAGARAAVVLTDHADRTDPDALRAVLWGSSDPRAEGGVGAGVVGRGLKITRTFFVHARRGALDDPAIRLLADDLAASGSEVALHSVTPERDDRAAVRSGLASSAAWRPATWIDHQPYTNCEAVSSRGAGDTAPWGVHDLLAGAGVRWVWAAGDVDGRAGSRIVNLLGGDPAEARPAIFPLPTDPRLWIFRSSMFHAAPAELAAALSDDALAALERERGLFVAHTYLGPSARTTQSRGELVRLAVVEQGGGYVVHPALDRAFARLAAHVRSGRLASLVWVDAGDRLRAIGDVEVTYLPDGGAEIRNHSPVGIESLTLSVPAAGLELALEGAALLGRENDDDGSARVWFDLPAGEGVILRAWDGVSPVPLLPFQ